MTQTQRTTRSAPACLPAATRRMTPPPSGLKLIRVREQSQVARPTGDFAARLAQISRLPAARQCGLRTTNRARGSNPRPHVAVFSGRQLARRQWRPLHVRGRGPGLISAPTRANSPGSSGLDTD